MMENISGIDGTVEYNRQAREYALDALKKMKALEQERKSKMRSMKINNTIVHSSTEVNMERFKEYINE